MADSACVCVSCQYTREAIYTLMNAATRMWYVAIIMSLGFITPECLKDGWQYNIRCTLISLPLCPMYIYGQCRVVQIHAYLSGKTHTPQQLSTLHVQIASTLEAIYQTTCVHSPRPVSCTCTVLYKVHVHCIAC